MAEILKDFAFNGFGKRNDYDWEKWSDGETWCLTAGEDFKATLASFQSAARSHGQHHGLIVQISMRRLSEGKVIIRFTPKSS